MNTKTAPLTYYEAKSAAHARFHGSMMVHRWDLANTQLDRTELIERFTRAYDDLERELDVIHEKFLGQQRNQDTTGVSNGDA